MQKQFVTYSLSIISTLYHVEGVAEDESETYSHLIGRYRESILNIKSHKNDVRSVQASKGRRSIWNTRESSHAMLWMITIKKTISGLTKNLLKNAVVICIVLLYK